jgi:transaldolase
VEPKIVEELLKKFVEFRKAYEEDGMKIEEFDSYGATVRTIRGFSQGCQDLAALIRDFMLPNPDV